MKDQKELLRLELAGAEWKMRTAIVALVDAAPPDLYAGLNVAFARYRDAAWDAHNRERAEGPLANGGTQ